MREKKISSALLLGDGKILMRHGVVDEKKKMTGSRKLEKIARKKKIEKDGHRQE